MVQTVAAVFATRILLLAIVVFAGSANAQSPAGVESGFVSRSILFNGQERKYQVYVPPEYRGDRLWPVILFLHGGGQEGTDGLRQTQNALGAAVRRHPERYPAIIVFPQVGSRSAWAGREADLALKTLEATEKEFKTDPDRVYLTGLSRGGGGTWYIAYRNPERFAALLVICGRVTARPGEPFLEAGPTVPPSEGELFETLALGLRNVPVWVFHGDADKIISVEESRRIVSELRALGAPVRYTELPGVGHNSWDSAYTSPEVVNWLLAQSKDTSDTQTDAD